MFKTIFSYIEATLQLTLVTLSIMWLLICTILAVPAFIVLSGYSDSGTGISCFKKGK